uniref:Uncharacterized protein n=1 Tax=Leersia perrieri TaxID=77586 RepID=A0A0D9WRW3_9ORYZ
MGCWGGLSVNCGERHNHLLCQYAGTKTEAWRDEVKCTTDMELMQMRNQSAGLLQLLKPLFKGTLSTEQLDCNNCSNQEANHPSMAHPSARQSHIAAAALFTSVKRFHILQVNGGVEAERASDGYRKRMAMIRSVRASPQELKFKKFNFGLD